MEGKTEIHMGRIIKQKLESKKMTIKEFAKAICCSRSNVYSIFDRESLDMKQLIRISTVLEFDFTQYLNKQTKEQKKKKYLIAIIVDDRKLDELKSDDLIDILICEKLSKA